MDELMELAEELRRMADRADADDREVAFVSINELRRWSKQIEGFAMLRAAQEGTL